MSANSQVARNQSRQIFGSVYESTSLATTIAGQHMVEWFTGKSLNTDRWGFGGGGSSSGTANSVAMADSVDGGIELTAGGTAWNKVWLTTGLSGTNAKDDRDAVALDYMRFDPSGCSLICVMKCTTGHATADECGVGFGTEASGYFNRNDTASSYFNNTMSNFTLRNIISGTNTRTQSSIAYDTAFHTHKIDLTSTYCTLSLDGVSAVTNTTGLVTTPVDVNICSSSGNNLTCTFNVTYLEAWNH